MARVDWSRLRHAHGAASDVPALLAAVGARTPEERAAAREALRDRFVTDEPTTGVAAAVEALATLVLEPQAPEPGEGIRLLVDLVMVDPDAYFAEPFGGAKAVKKMTKLERAAHDALVARSPELVEALGRDDARARAAACLALSFVVPLSPEALDALSRAADDDVETVRTSALLALARIGRHTPALGVDVSKRAERAAPNVRAIVHFLLGHPVDAADLSALASSLAGTPLAGEDFPWSKGDLADVAAAILRARGDASLALVVATAVGAGGDRARMRDAALTLHLLFGEGGRQKRLREASSLDTTQREALGRLAEASADTDYARYGLPSGPSHLSRWLASDTRTAAATPPIERPIEIAGAGTRPAWQWLEALFRKEVDAPALLTALRATFSPAELLSVLRDGTRGAFGAALPPMALVASAVDHTGDDLDAYRALADETVGLATVAPPAALLAVLPLARRGVFDAKYDPLFARVFRGNDRAVIAAYAALLPAEVAARVQPKPKR